MFRSRVTWNKRTTSALEMRLNDPGLCFGPSGLFSPLMASFYSEKLNENSTHILS